MKSQDKIVGPIIQMPGSSTKDQGDAYKVGREVCFPCATALQGGTDHAGQGDEEEEDALLATIKYGNHGGCTSPQSPATGKAEEHGEWGMRGVNNDGK